MKEEPAFELRERTKQFGLRIVRMFVALPKTDEARVLGRQVLRSGTSVGANYREAHRSRSKAEFIAKIGDCLKELDEPSGARQTTRSVARRVSAGALIKLLTGLNSSPNPASSHPKNSPPSKTKRISSSPSSPPSPNAPKTASSPFHNS
jgi:four helix bundle protein